MARGSPDWQPWTAVQRFSGTGGASVFQEVFTVPANTPESSPVSQDIELAKGFIAKIHIRFPAGPCGMLKVAIYDQSTRLFPPVATQWFSGDNEVIEWDTEYDVPHIGGVYKITAVGYNEDDTYEHSALIRVWVVRCP